MVVIKPATWVISLLVPCVRLTALQTWNTLNHCPANNYLPESDEEAIYQAECQGQLCHPSHRSPQQKVREKLSSGVRYSHLPGCWQAKGRHNKKDTNKENVHFQLELTNIPPLAAPAVPFNVFCFLCLWSSICPILIINCDHNSRNWGKKHLWWIFDHHLSVTSLLPSVHCKMSAEGDERWFVLNIAPVTHNREQAI